MPTLKGTEASLVLCTMFLVSCIFFNKCLYFSYYMAGYLLDRPRVYIKEVTQDPVGLGSNPDLST